MNAGVSSLFSSSLLVRNLVQLGYASTLEHVFPPFQLFFLDDK